MLLKPKLGLAMLVFAGCVLASCDSNGGSRGNSGDDRTAAGEVRGGTISDDMLPLDSLKSQSPPLRESAASGSDASADSSEEPDDGEEGGADETVAPAETEEPA